MISIGSITECDGAGGGAAYSPTLLAVSLLCQSFPSIEPSLRQYPATSW